MKKEELVIIVPGAKYIKSNLKFFQKIIVSFYEMMNVHHPIHNNYAELWTKRLGKEGRKVFYLHWNRGFSNYSVNLAKRKLKRIINEYQNNHDVKIAGISLGGEIAIETANELNDDSIKKIILICSTNKNQNISLKMPIINIYSSVDLLAKISTRILAPVKGGMRLIGKTVTNLVIDDFSHDDFCLDKEIPYGAFKGKTMTQLVDFLLK